MRRNFMRCAWECDFCGRLEVDEAFERRGKMKRWLDWLTGITDTV